MSKQRLDFLITDNLKWGADMNIFLAQQESKLRDEFFPEFIMNQLDSLGNLRMNNYGRVMTEEELAQELIDIDVCIVIAWEGCPRFTEEVLQKAVNLKLIVTPAASVASFITDRVYEKGIKVCSANDIMAKYVAEGTLTYILTALREVPKYNLNMKKGKWESVRINSLIDAKIGLVGLGTVGRYLIEFLKPFNVDIKVYDPYVNMKSLQQYDNVSLCSLEEVLIDSDVISIHASKTDETYRIINRERLSLIKEGALLVNTARGALIDEEALIDELRIGRISAVLDVYEKEPLPFDSPLRQLEDVIIMPHAAGMIDLTKLSLSTLQEIKRFKTKEPLQNEIPFEQYSRMTR